MKRIIASALSATLFAVTASAQSAAPSRPKADWRQIAPAIEARQCVPRLTGRWTLMRTLRAVDTRQPTAWRPIDLREMPLQVELGDPTSDGRVETYRGTARGGVFTPGDTGRVTVHVQPYRLQHQMHLYIRFPTGLSRGSPNAGADETYIANISGDGSVHPLSFWVQGTNNPTAASWRLIGKFPCGPARQLRRDPNILREPQ